MWQQLKNLIFAFPRALDRWLSKFDLRSHRIDETRLHDRGYLEGYSRTALWLPAVVLFFLAYGLPRRFHWQFLFDRGWGLLAVFAAALVVHILICKKAKGRWLPRLQFVLLAAVALGVFLVANSPQVPAKQLDARAYPHIYAWLGALVLLFAMPINRWAAERWVLGLTGHAGKREKLRQAFVAQLAKTQLFVTPPKEKQQFSQVLAAFTLVPLTSPVLLVVLPAIVAIVIPRQWLWVSVGLVFAGWWLLLAAAHYEQRLSAFLEIGRQIAVRGGPGVVSAIVILLAVLRLVGVDYVTTVLDQSSKWVLAGFVAMLYLLFWLYEYWSQRAMSEVLLGLLHEPAASGEAEPEGTKYPAWVAYPKGDAPPELDANGVARRRLQIHGNGRLMAIEETDRRAEPENYQAHPALEVFRRIHRQLACRARLVPGVGWDDADTVGDAVRLLEQRSRLYSVVPALAIAAIVASVGMGIFTREQALAIDARNLDDRSGLFQLSAALEARPGASEVYAVAASGGGTRAAVYTYTVLKALRERQLLDRVVLVSGVSGGSLGLAYYLAHQEELLAAQPPAVAERQNPDDPWSCYSAATVAPYISSVLAGAGEYRLLKGTRLGQLLTEGFEREIGSAKPNCRTSPKPSFGERPDTGFVFNSGVSGAWRADSLVAQSCFDQGDGTLKRNCGSVATRGSRLALTNVASFTPQEVGSQYGGWNFDFDYAVVNDPTVSFAKAASVSANFPPIFSNAAVLLRASDRGEQAESRRDARYWITDGGAVENRGMISILLALRSEIRSMESAVSTDPGATEPPELAVCEAEPTQRAPGDGTWIKVIGVNAAGGSEGYSEDRGTSVALGAGREIADKLIAELARQVDREYCVQTQGKARVKIVYLPMPRAVARAFGTHWQLLASTSVSDPVHWYEPDPAIALSGEDMLDVIDLLFSDFETRLSLTFENPAMPARLGRWFGMRDEEEAELWNQYVHSRLWHWIGLGSDGGAGEDPWTRIERELEF